MKQTGIKRDLTAKVHEFTFIYNPNGPGMDELVEIKEAVVNIQEPSWDVVAEAYKYLTDDNGKMDLITPGKLIFDLCAFEVDEELVKNNRAMLSICSQLAVKFVLPINTELKKN